MVDVVSYPTSNASLPLKHWCIVLLYHCTVSGSSIVPLLLIHLTVLTRCLAATVPKYYKHDLLSQCVSMNYYVEYSK